jgi:hypothetical protein
VGFGRIFCGTAYRKKPGYPLQFLPLRGKNSASIPCAAKKWPPCHFLALGFCFAKTQESIQPASVPAAVWSYTVRRYLPPETNRVFNAVSAPGGGHGPEEIIARLTDAETGEKPGNFQGFTKGGPIIFPRRPAFAAQSPYPGRQAPKHWGLFLCR